ncbi:hypothetical protein GH975_05855 [Litorivicinus lipolyticus]|uniref:O-antigen ligase n=1 Tax=Litorivicinus lipolyticus TaxID=418701 RepID=A0A5Q2QA72_9GAMM|nr:hypothetical protein [Litorivicinus lipolyticus]QGG80123.1 hypothetical protein GH975_05855 [Litorivicinus lipolyticus]
MSFAVFGVFLLLVLFGSLRWLVPTLVAFAVLVPFTEGLVVAGIDLKYIRLLSLAGLVRLIAMGRFSLELNQVDRVYLFWVLSGFAVFMLANLNGSSFVYRAGMAFDGLVLWALARWALNADWYGVAVRAFTVALVLVSISVAAELYSGSNVLGAIGQPDALWRDGKARLYAAFDHPILMGSFFAAVLPLVLGLWVTQKISKISALVAGALTVMIVLSTSSSGPIAAMAVGVLAFAGFKLKSWVYPGLIALVLIAGVLHFLVMEQSVWLLLGRLDLTGSSTGYHRYWLIEQTVNHFNEWFLVGTRDISHWNVWANDVTSMYVLQAITGGLVVLVAFFWMCWKLFVRLENTESVDPIALPPVLQWGLFCSFLTQLASFMSVAYWGQTLVLFGFWVALYSSLPRQRTAQPQQQSRPAVVGSSPKFQRPAVSPRSLG